MCVIIYKGIGVEAPSKEIFESCWESNPDGFGMCYADGTKVVLDKGYMNFASAWKAARNVPTEHAALFHFRIGTSGKNDGPTCHPFPISTNQKDLRALRFDNLPYAIAHNGIISSKGEGKLSDTQVWVRDKLSMLYTPEMLALPQHKELVKMLLEDAAAAYNSRFALLNADCTCWLSGEWHDHKSGLMFSNNHWDFPRYHYGYSYGGNKTSAYKSWHDFDNKTASWFDKPAASTSMRDAWFDDEDYYYTCPVCGSHEVMALEESQHDLCECYDCGAVYSERTKEEYVPVSWLPAEREEPVAKAAYVQG